MPISIKNAETETLARKVADLTGESITDAVRETLSERYDRLKRHRGGSTLEQRLNEIAISCAKLPNVSAMTDDEILGYDEFGIPRR